MPPRSKKQKRFMQAVEHNEEFAHKVGVSKEVARKILHHKGRSKTRRKACRGK